MRLVLQRVTSASVSVDGEVIASVGRGIVLLAGFGRDDEVGDPARMAEKLVHLRIFPDATGKLQQSLVDIGGGILAVPQFTLYARLDRGRRPDFTGAMGPDEAARRFDALIEVLRRCPGVIVQTGRFGADMGVSLVNDGPFTLALGW